MSDNSRHGKTADGSRKFQLVESDEYLTDLREFADTMPGVSVSKIYRVAVRRFRGLSETTQAALLSRPEE